MKKKTDELAPLTAKQQRFCDEYLIDLNATEAAIRAGYSIKTARSIASENLTKPNIQKFISEQKEKISEELQVTREQVIAQYIKIGFFDIRTIYDDNGNLKPIKEVDDNAAAAIGGVETMELVSGKDSVHIADIKKVKIRDSKAALDSICKVMGFNAPEKVAQTDTKGKDVKPMDYSKLTDKELNQLITLERKASAK